MRSRGPLLTTKLQIVVLAVAALAQQRLPLVDVPPRFFQQHIDLVSRVNAPSLSSRKLSFTGPNIMPCSTPQVSFLSNWWLGLGLNKNQGSIPQATNPNHQVRGA